MSIGQVDFWVTLSVSSREERVAECKEGDFVKRDLFSLLYWESAKVRPNGHFFIWSVLFRGCRVVMPNGHPFSIRCLRFGGCRAEMTEWPFLMSSQCFNVQR